MSKRVALITGAYGAIGKAIAHGIAKRQDHEIVLAGRNKEALENVVAALRESTTNPDIRAVMVDLSSQYSIDALQEKWQGPLHIMINNAATTPVQRQLNADGIEMQWATNVLGYFWMMHYMSKFMKDVDDARIVNVASYWAGGLDLNDVEFAHRTYDNDAAYRQSKQADRMLSIAFADLLIPFGITVNACHPGDVNSKLSNSLGFGGHESPKQGAETPVWLATAPDVKGIYGKYFEHAHQTTCRFSNNKEEIESLYNQCLTYSVITK